VEVVEEAEEEDKEVPGEAEEEEEEEQEEDLMELHPTGHLNLYRPYRPNHQRKANQ
jgi:hypothetical protein